MATINYSVVKVAEISVNKMIEYGDSTNKAQNMLEKKAGMLWNSVVVLSAPIIAQQFATKDDCYKALTEAMEKNIVSSITLPEFIKNGKGENVPLQKKDGSVKWSSWDQTKRAWAYLSDIAKIVTCGLSSELYPEDGKVAARCDILALCKGTETPIEGVRRYQKGLQGCLDLMTDPAEITEAHGLVSALCVNNLDPEAEALQLVIKLDAILSSCDTTEKETILKAMNRLTKHFA